MFMVNKDYQKNFNTMCRIVSRLKWRSIYFFGNLNKSLKLLPFEKKLC